MIFCKKSDLKRYLGLDAILDEGIRYVLSQDPLTFAPGKQDEDGVTYFPLSAVLALAVIAYVFRSELFDLLRALA